MATTGTVGQDQASPPAAGAGVDGPRDLVVGVGASRGVVASDVLALIGAALDGAGLDAARVGALATLDSRATEVGLVEAARRLGVPLVGRSAAELAAVPVPGGSARVLAAVGTPSVAEAAALAGGGTLLVPKQVSRPAGRRPGVTCAIARTGSRPPVTSAGIGPQAT
ncbi:cobalamin biosynthesis protein [Streptomyces sp. NPDC005805]|uniref:cobalamin biosynthesis protein n=1 Tax=Streptomyces sp. NPDC005805 TaxID=3157068 RepID=UPI0033D386C3